jgi:hypothetical protein
MPKAITTKETGHKFESQVATWIRRVWPASFPGWKIKVLPTERLLGLIAEPCQVDLVVILTRKLGPILWDEKIIGIECKNSGKINRECVQILIQKAQETNEKYHTNPDQSPYHFDSLAIAVNGEFEGEVRSLASKKDILLIVHHDRGFDMMVEGSDWLWSPRWGKDL